MAPPSLGFRWCLPLLLAFVRIAAATSAGRGSVAQDIGSKRLMRVHPPHEASVEINAQGALGSMHVLEAVQPDAKAPFVVEEDEGFPSILAAEAGDVAPATEADNGDAAVTEEKDDVAPSTHVAEDGAEAPATEALTSEPEVELIDEEDEKFEIGAHREMFECAADNESCTCSNGVVMYGQKNREKWAVLRVDGAVNCSSLIFSDVAPGEQKVCRCYSLSWCTNSSDQGQYQVSNGFKLDPAHRRRNPYGTKGINLYQRRRWCGYGPRDCQWSGWADWGACSSDCAQGGGTQLRVRTKEAEAQNGGSCNGTAGESEARSCICENATTVSTNSTASDTEASADSTAHTEATDTGL